MFVHSPIVSSIRLVRLRSAPVIPLHETATTGPRPGLVTTTSMVLLGGSVEGLRVTTRLSAELLTPADIVDPFANRPTLLLVKVEILRDSENVRTGFVFNPILVAPSEGVTETTEGGVVSGVAVVEKVLKKELAVFPARSVGYVVEPT